MTKSKFILLKEFKDLVRGNTNKTSGTIEPKTDYIAKRGKIFSQLKELGYTINIIGMNPDNYTLQPFDEKKEAAPDKHSYYTEQLKEIKLGGEYPPTLKIQDSKGNSTNFISINKESATELIKWLKQFTKTAKEAKLKNFKYSFTGRENGAIGKFYKVTKTYKEFSEKEAFEKL